MSELPHDYTTILLRKSELGLKNTLEDYGLTVTVRFCRISLSTLNLTATTIFALKPYVDWAMGYLEWRGLSSDFVVFISYSVSFLCLFHDLAFFLFYPLSSRLYNYYLLPEV